MLTLKIRGNNEIDHNKPAKGHAQITTGWHTNTYLKDPDKEKCHGPRKTHMNHGECYRKRKVKVLWRENPLQKNRKKTIIILNTLAML